MVELSVRAGGRYESFFTMKALLGLKIVFFVASMRFLNVTHALPVLLRSSGGSGSAHSGARGNGCYWVEVSQIQ